MESQYWPPEADAGISAQPAHAACSCHARENVPFYKTRLDPLFKKNGEIDWNRWHEIPIVSRADLRDRRNELLATELPPGHGPSKTFSDIRFIRHSHRDGNHAVLGAGKPRRHPQVSRAPRNSSNKIERIFLQFVPNRANCAQSEYLSKREKRPFSRRGCCRHESLFSIAAWPKAANWILLQADGVDYIYRYSKQRGSAGNCQSLPQKSRQTGSPYVSRPRRDVGTKKLVSGKLWCPQPVHLQFRGKRPDGISMCRQQLDYHLNSEMVFLEILTAEGRAAAGPASRAALSSRLFSTRPCRWFAMNRAILRNFCRLAPAAATFR